MVKIINDRGKAGRTFRTWKIGIGNEAEEKRVVTYRGTYASARRIAITIAESEGCTVVEFYRDEP
jgi:hypothetical protein